MDVDERLTGQAQRGQLVADPAARLGARHQQQAALLRRRLQTEPAQGVEVALGHVAPGHFFGCGLEVGEGLFPALAAPGHARPDRPARLEQAAQPGAAPVFGEVHDQVVPGCLQAAVERQFGAQLAEHAELLPLPVDAQHLADRRMIAQHLGGIGIDQRVDLDLRRLRLQRSEYRRRNQHVAVVAQFDHQRPADFAEGDGIAQLATARAG